MTLGADSLEGVMVALVTPVTDEGVVDLDALTSLVRSLVTAGVAGFSPVGTTGEGASLSLADRLTVVDTVVAAVPPGTPVIPGVFRDTLDEAADDLAAYAEHRAAGALVAPPHYFRLDSPDIQGFFEALVDQASLPMVLYNIPSFTKNPLAPPVLGALASDPRVVGVKDSSRDMEYLLQVVDVLDGAGVGSEQFSIMTGTDTMLLASLAAGARGAIVASANLVPHLSVGIHRAWARGDLAEAGKLERRLRQVVAACRTGTFPAGWKAAVAANGSCRPWLVAPRAPLGEHQAAKLEERLRALGVVDGSAYSPRPS